VPASSPVLGDRTIVKWSRTRFQDHKTSAEVPGLAWKKPLYGTGVQSFCGGCAEPTGVFKDGE
jgi:hypothetical protein